jgi:hypothetical protein
MERASRETWAKRVERWTDSGLTAKEYAAEAGLNAHSLAWWKWRLGAEGRSRGSARVDVSAAKSAPTRPLTFVEVPASERAESLEIVLPSKIRVRVPSTFDTSALVRLLDVLEKRP